MEFLNLYWKRGKSIPLTLDSFFNLDQSKEQLKKIKWSVRSNMVVFISGNILWKMLRKLKFD